VQGTRGKKKERARHEVQERRHPGSKALAEKRLESAIRVTAWGYDPEDPASIVRYAQEKLSEAVEVLDKLESLSPDDSETLLKEHRAVGEHLERMRNG
jgi:hypothetical protein